MGRKKGGGGGEDCGSWMDTYGDMVTLLLCFFVMLYSMSDLNQQKWEMFVKSIFPNSGDVAQVAINENISDGEFDVSGNLPSTDEELPEDLEELWITIVEKLNEQGVEGVSVSDGEGYTFVAFDNQAFFNGDSSMLTSEATELLDIFCDIIAPQVDRISQIEIMGHTSQGDPTHPNNPRTDRMLSALRSAEVAAYIQNKNIIDPSKLVGISYGQFRPVDTFETSEGRAKNRRVEFLIVDEGADIKSMNEYFDEYYSNIEKGSVKITGSDAFISVEEGSTEGNASMFSSPNTLENTEGQTPEEAANLPDTEGTGNTPNTEGQTPERPANTSDTTGQTPEAANTPDTTGQTPEAAANTPDITGQTPEAAANTPDITGQAPERAANTLNRAGLISERAGNAPDTAAQPADVPAE